MIPSRWQWRRSAESPWFYVACFSLFGAVVLTVAHEKYGERQAGIERRFQARSQIAAAPSADEGPAGEGPDADRPVSPSAYSTPEQTVIPLWPIGVLLGGLACASALLALQAGRVPEVDGVANDE